VLCSVLLGSCAVFLGSAPVLYSCDVLLRCAPVLLCAFSSALLLCTLLLFSATAL
jgi:hypothetical protein